MAIRPVDIGFAEFVATLLSETVDSVVASATQQEERHRTLREATTLSSEAFAATYVDDGEIEQLAATLFPGAGGKSTIVEGGRVPSKAALADLEIELVDGDARGNKLTASGVQKVLAALRALVSEQRQTALREAVGAGLPRVVVDDGRILAKLTMQILTETEDETAPAAAAAAPSTGGNASTTSPLLRSAVLGASGASTAARLTGAAGTGATVAAVGALDPAVLSALRPTFAIRPASTLSTGTLASTIPSVIKDLRLSVRPVTTEDASNEATASVFGEVEINFRTIY